MLARSIVEGKVCLQKLEEMRKMSVPAAEEASSVGSTYERLNKELSMISGFGPFTRANVLMCMGFFHTIPADTETIRHLKQVFSSRNLCIFLLGFIVDDFNIPCAMTEIYCRFIKEQLPSVLFIRN